MRKTRKKRSGRARSLRWEFPRHVPTCDFFDGMDLDGDLTEAVEVFEFCLEAGTFLAWEAVVSREQGLRLTPRQKEALDGLVAFGDSDDEAVLYIDELPRPSEPWYVILNRIAPLLLVEPFRTYEMQWEITSEGWPRLVKCVEEHAEGLSLPAGAATALDVVPAELRHKLTVQSCFTELEGIGQAGVRPLEKETYRIDEFVGRLRASRQSVAYLDLTLDSLSRSLVLPERDGQFLVKALKKVLGIRSSQDRIADYI